MGHVWYPSSMFFAEPAGRPHQHISWPARVNDDGAFISGVVETGSIEWDSRVPTKHPRGVDVDELGRLCVSLHTVLQHITAVCIKLQRIA